MQHSRNIQELFIIGQGFAPCQQTSPEIGACAVMCQPQRGKLRTQFCCADGGRAIRNAQGVQGNSDVSSSKAPRDTSRQAPPLKLKGLAHQRPLICPAQFAAGALGPGPGSHTRMLHGRFLSLQMLSPIRTFVFIWEQKKFTPWHGPPAPRPGAAHWQCLPAGDPERARLTPQAKY